MIIMIIVIKVYKNIKVKTKINNFCKNKNYFCFICVLAEVPCVSRDIFEAYYPPSPGTMSFLKKRQPIRSRSLAS